MYKDLETSQGVQDLRERQEIKSSRDLDGIKGTKIFDSGIDGPTAGLICLTHGNEQSGLETIQQMQDELRAIIRGRVLLVCANLAAAEQCKRFIEEDMNRVYTPDMRMPLFNERNRSLRQNESSEVRRAKELRQAFDQMDTALDLHSVTSTPGAKSFTVIPGGRDNQIEMAQSFDVDYQVLYPSYFMGTGSTSDYFTSIDRPCITLELGYERDYDPETAKANIRRYLKFAGVIDEAEDFEDQAQWLRLGQTELVQCAQTIGYNRRFVRESFKPYKKGQLIGTDFMKGEYRVDRDSLLLFSKNVEDYFAGKSSMMEPFVYFADEIDPPTVN